MTTGPDALPGEPSEAAAPAGADALISWQRFRNIVGANQYLTLATADADGSPWSSPVWFATADCVEFIWISSPQSRHSRNIAVRPRVAVSIFDSTQPPLTGDGVYLSAVAEPVPEDRLDAAFGIYSDASVRAGLSGFTRAEVEAAGRLRLYRAMAAEHFVLDDHDQRVAVVPD